MAGSAMVQRRESWRVRSRGIAGGFGLSALGLLALAVAVLVAIVGLAAYGAEMGPHLVAEAVGIFRDAALVVLVLDRMARLQQRRAWNFAQDVVSQGIAACMVDVVRLCGVRWNVGAYNANVARYGEFVDVLRLHLTDLRSNLEGLALGAEPRAYEQARLIERRLGWICVRVSATPATAALDPEYMMIADTVEHARRFVENSGAATTLVLWRLTSAQNVGFVANIISSTAQEDAPNEPSACGQSLKRRYSERPSPASFLEMPCLSVVPAFPDAS